MGVHRFPSILAAAALAASLLLVRSGVDPRAVLADHGAYQWPSSGVTGYWNGPAWRCESSAPNIVIYAPDVLGATYEKENAQSQLVYWTARVWWVGADNVYHHTYADEYGSDMGWYRAWVRPGDSHGGLIVYPERGSTGGAAGAVSWVDANGNTMTANPFTRTYTPNNPAGNVFMVEFMFFWSSNADTPYSGWLSQMASMGDGYGNSYLSCRL